jgi:hypothetical protein
MHQHQLNELRHAAHVREQWYRILSALDSPGVYITLCVAVSASELTLVGVPEERLPFDREKLREYGRERINLAEWTLKENGVLLGHTLAGDGIEQQSKSAPSPQSCQAPESLKT